MPLSDYEKQVLAQMEAQLASDDPALATRLGSSHATTQPRKIAWGVVLAIVGITALVTGVALGGGIASVLVGVSGFVLMVAGVMLVLVGLRGVSVLGNQKSQRKASDKSSFMDRQQDRWDQRNAQP